MHQTSVSLQDLGALDPDSELGKEWEQIVRASHTSGFMQSCYWAQHKRQLGLKVLHLGLFEQERLFGGAIFYAAPNAKGAGFLACPDGPVLPWDNLYLAENGLQLLVEATRAESSAMGIMSLRIAPRIADSEIELLHEFSRAPLNLTESKTMYLDLSATPEKIIKSIKPKARYNIGLAERKNVIITESDSPLAARDFHAVMQIVAQRDGFIVEPLSAFMGLVETLAPNKMVRIFFAHHGDDLLGALLMITYGDRATYLYGGTTDIKRNLMGGYALQWAAIKAAWESGARTYDFWGYDPTVKSDHAYAGFSRFKSQFCGETIELIGTLDYYFIDNLADVVIRAMKEVALVSAEPPKLS